MAIKTIPLSRLEMDLKKTLNESLSGKGDRHPTSCGGIGNNPQHLGPSPLFRTGSECAETGETVVVEMPDQRLVAIQSLEPQEDDSLIDELLACSPKFQALVTKSKASPRKPFTVGE